MENNQQRMARLTMARLLRSPVEPRGVRGSWFIYERLRDIKFFKFLWEDHFDADLIIKLFGDSADRLPEIWPLRSRTGSLVGFHYSQVADDLSWGARCLGEVDSDLYRLATNISWIGEGDKTIRPPPPDSYRAPPDG